MVMRGDLFLKFLDLIQEVGGSFEDHLVGFLKAGYGASVRGIEYETGKHRRYRERDILEKQLERRLKQRYFVMRRTLEQQGVIGSSNGKMIITQKGIFKMRRLRGYAAERLRIPAYKLGDGSRATMIIFDIPEKDRRKREWLREVLRGMGCRRIQQSVWLAVGVLPKDFLVDLDRMRLSEFVEICEITKTGTLDDLK